MFQHKSIRSFFIKAILGMLFLSLSLYTLVSLIGYNVIDSGFGAPNTEGSVYNYGGVYGAYFASFILTLFHYSAYFFPLFFFITGFRQLLGIDNRYFFLKFFTLLFGILILSLNISLMNLNSGLVGVFLKNLWLDFFYQQININFLFWIILCFQIFLSVLLIYLGLGFKINKLNSKIFFLIKFIGSFFVIFSLIKKIIIKKQKNKTLINEFRKTKLRGRPIKSEPTIKKTNKNKSNLSHNDKILETEDIRYILPPLSLLKTSNEKSNSSREVEKRNNEFSKKLEIILMEYGVEGKIVNFKSGPVVTLYEFLPAAGVKTSKVVGLSEDIARAMSSLSARISSQPGKTSIGIEIPNPRRESVLLGDLIKDEQFSADSTGLKLALGKNIGGEKKFTDLEKMPHLLIAGTTGSGKSVGINSMIVSLLFRFAPSECKLILIDPKMLELSIYENIPHLLTPVVTNPNKAIFALKWVVKEMENRYRLMSSLNVKNIKSFNSKIINALSTGKKLYLEVQTGVDRDTRMPIIEKKEIALEKMPLIVVVIDEMADLMMVAGKEVESLVQRLAQMARASGIHLIAATQRPSVDVITGTIKANFPSRISFRVASRFDSRTILNEMGAEQLLGSGDMLFLENGAHLTRLHGGFISESEIENIVNHIKSQSALEKIKDITIEENNEKDLNLSFSEKNVDELYEKAVSIIIEQQKVSTSFVQRYLQIGYNRAARIIEKMEDDGYISEASHSGKRNVLKKSK